MKIKGAIFDMDGTLLDSMPMWRTTASRYLKTLGVEPDSEVNTKCMHMSLYEGACYLKERYDLPLSPDEVMSGMSQYISDFYVQTVQMKDGAAAFLRALHKKNVRMCVATVTFRELAQAALTRCGVMECFTDIVTCADVGQGKNRPEVFERALSVLKTKKEETIVFEDSFYAAQTAKNAGFFVSGIYDAAESADVQLRQVADRYFMSWDEAYSLLSEVVIQK